LAIGDRSQPELGELFLLVNTFPATPDHVFRQATPFPESITRKAPHVEDCKHPRIANGCKIDDMAQIHMSEAEVVNDIRNVLDRVSHGTEVIVRQGDRPLAVIKPIVDPPPGRRRGPGRPIDECIALASARGSRATLDEDFAADLQEIIARRQPFDTSLWD
jgi:antitoxin (DNA-binding transcriptional repressor) of toxin-antitoxin stability system